MAGIPSSETTRWSPAPDRAASTGQGQGRYRLKSRMDFKNKSSGPARQTPARRRWRRPAASPAVYGRRPPVPEIQLSLLRVLILGLAATATSDPTFSWFTLTHLSATLVFGRSSQHARCTRLLDFRNSRCSLDVPGGLHHGGHFLHVPARFLNPDNVRVLRQLSITSTGRS